MSTIAKCLSFAVLAGWLCLAQTATPAAVPSPQASPAAATDKPHGVMPVELAKSIDSRKLKDGDVVSGKITADLRTRDGQVISKGSKINGHVTEIRSRGKGDSETSLGIAFDKIVLTNGKELPVEGRIQALAPNPNAGGAPDASIGTSMMAGHENGAAGTTPPPMPKTDTGPTQKSALLGPQSKGVVGIKNLELGESGVLISSGKDIKLDSGTQMMVMVTFQ